MKKTKEKVGLIGIWFILPSFLGFLVLFLIPYLIGIKLSFQNSSLDSTFVGFSNYILLFQNEAFRLAVKNTLFFMGIAIPLILVISFLLALILYEIPTPGFVKLFIILPMFIPSGTVAGFFNDLFGNGVDNLLNSDKAMWVLIVLFIWRNTGYNLILYLAGLLRIDKSIIESSEIDGVNYWEKVQHIYMPLCTPTTVFVTVLSIINSFKVFKDIYILQGPYPNPRVYLLQHFMTNKFQSLQYAELTSAAYVFTIGVLVVVYLLFLVDRNYAKKVGERQ
ncbi:sugar ABC transporter permease [Gottschalkiaceae bacterium SANA]|nr:sugar ABC transporter permease [Gottschalkiaceae bacterium SANA]